MKTCDLIGKQLDWAAAKAQGYITSSDGISTLIQIDSRSFIIGPTLSGDLKSRYTPSTSWAQGSVIIEQELIQTSYTILGWRAQGFDYNCVSYGPTPLIAAMRCYVASKFGDEIEIPKELL